MELSHLLQLVSEIPQNTTLQYVRGNNQCKFINVDIDGKRINSVTPNEEDRSWAPSYLEDLAPKIFENEPFNLSGLLNDKGSYRPVLETIIAHTREFYTVKKGTATALVWVPSKPKANLELEEIDATFISAIKPHTEYIQKIDQIIFNPIIDKEYSIEELGDILHKLNSSIEDGKKTAMFTLFGLKYGKSIDKASKILAAAGLRTNLHANSISTGKQLYEFISERQLGFAFWSPTLSISRNINPSKKLKTELDCTPRQVIYYGAPGTGKSYKIKGLVKEGNHVRTTFHPDSDYASFVGAYKPTMIEVSARDMSGHVIEDKATNKPVQEKKIVYEFVAQAFLQAYVEAWKRSAGIMTDKEGKNVPMPEGIDDNYYLVIEEINRGNCAQIFGDLFQLLDRDDNGESSYAIRPDQDIKRYLAEQFNGIDALPEAIGSGAEMKLPSNLYIFATMNTSDQSLFPIDSAFKRRWDWEYVPIKDEKKGYYIKVGDTAYLWSDFLDKINEKILKSTNSDDKQMGYWFVHLPEGQKEISTDKFVGKVLFYLWNDVFKDFGDGEDTIFVGEKEDGSKYDLRFKSFFGEKRDEHINDLMRYNKVEPTEITDDDEEQDSLSGEVKPVSSEVKEWQAQFDNYWKGFQEYWEKDPDIKSRFHRFQANAMLLTVDGTDEIRMRFSMHPTHWHKVSINLRVKDGSPESQVLKDNLDTLRELTGESEYQYVVDRNYGLVQLRSSEVDFKNPDEVTASYDWLLTQSHKLLEALNTLRANE